jgi:hypothetical protein
MMLTTIVAMKNINMPKAFTAAFLFLASPKPRRPDGVCSKDLYVELD